MGFAERLAEAIRSMHGHLDETSPFEANTRTIIALVIVVVVRSPVCTCLRPPYARAYKSQFVNDLFVPDS